MLTGEKAEVVRVMCRDDATPEPDRSRHRKSVDRHLASGASMGEEVTCDPSDPDTGGHHLCEPSRKQRVDGLVRTVPSIELDENSGGDANRRVPLVGTAHRRPHALVTLRVLLGAGKGGDRFAVED